MYLCKCIGFYALAGAAGFFLGRLLPKTWFHPQLAPFRCRPSEQEGKVYEKLGIKRWQNRLPDMSRILPGVMPAKNLAGDYRQRLWTMLEETCVAEFTHAILCIAGLYGLKLWPGLGGLVVCLLYTAANLVYIGIQRYNRPRLLRLYRKCGGSLPESGNRRPAGNGLFGWRERTEGKL